MRLIILLIVLLGNIFPTLAQAGSKDEDPFVKAQTLIDLIYGESESRYSASMFSKEGCGKRALASFDQLRTYQNHGESGSFTLMQVVFYLHCGSDELDRSLIPIKDMEQVVNNAFALKILNLRDELYATPTIKRLQLLRKLCSLEDIPLRYLSLSESDMSRFRARARREQRRQRSHVTQRELDEMRSELKELRYRLVELEYLLRREE